MEARRLDPFPRKQYNGDKRLKDYLNFQQQKVKSQQNLRNLNTFSKLYDLQRTRLYSCFSWMSYRISPSQNLVVLPIEFQLTFRFPRGDSEEYELVSQTQLGVSMSTVHA